VRYGDVIGVLEAFSTPSVTTTVIISPAKNESAGSKVAELVPYEKEPLYMPLCEPLTITVDEFMVELSIPSLKFIVIFDVLDTSSAFKKGLIDVTV